MLSCKEQYRTICHVIKRDIRADRNAKRERQTSELTDAIRQNVFNGFALLTRQNRSRSKPVLPPTADFTNHYQSHYDLDPETPILLLEVVLA